MSTNETDTPRVQRVRHELKKRALQVQKVERLSPLFQRVTLTGESLADFVSAAHDDHVKIMLPDATGETVMREYTPRHFDTARTLVLDFALHGEGRRPAGRPRRPWARR
jgi:NADPH-dependent ferric siderophore reductase